MTIREIRLSGFRNYSEFTSEFVDRVNVIIGDNAQGKTNLLEAIYFISTGRSFRAKSDRELIQFGRDSARILAEADSHGRSHTLEARLYRQKRRQLLSNGVALKTAGELSGKLRAVLFCPDDLDMIREGAAVRRKLLDNSLCQLRPRYAAILSEFSRVLEHKTRILRDHREKPSLLDALDEFDLCLMQTSAELIHYRAAYTALLSDKASKIHREFSGDREDLSVTYKTVKTIPDPSAKPSEILPFLLEHLREHRRAELETGSCLSGAHKDDLEFGIGGFAARSFASQGQARTAALSVKLAERELHYEDSGEYPLLLLDDVLSELDAARQNFVLNKIGAGQVFITCCEDARIASRTGGKLLRIDSGRLG
jgi:DNA replication and repair protein RecF